MTREEIIGMGAVMMDAGARTAASFLQSFVLALINNPHVQEKGQKEIDSVVGPDRWPTLDDYELIFARSQTRSTDLGRFYRSLSHT